MIKTLQIVSVCCGTLGLILAIVALSTPSWMLGCTTMGKLADEIAKMTPGESNDMGLDAMKSMKVCIETGLFKVVMSMGSILHYTIKIPINDLDQFIEATAGLIVVGAILLLPALVVLTLSAASSSLSAQRKLAARNYSRVGCLLLVLSGIFIGAGTMVYTVPQSKSVHNSTRFLQEIATTLTKAMMAISQNGQNQNADFSMFGDNQDTYPSYTGSSPSDLDSLSKLSDNEAYRSGSNGDSSDLESPLLSSSLGSEAFPPGDSVDDTGSRSSDLNSLNKYSVLNISDGETGKESLDLNAYNIGSNSYVPKSSSDYDMKSLFNSSNPFFTGNGNMANPSNKDSQNNDYVSGGLSNITLNGAPIDLEHHSSYPSHMDDTNMATSYLLLMFRSINPMFGYSLYLAWISFVMIIFAVGCAITSCRGISKYGSESDRVPML